MSDEWIEKLIKLAILLKRVVSNAHLVLYSWIDRFGEHIQFDACRGGGGGNLMYEQLQLSTGVTKLRDKRLALEIVLDAEVFCVLVMFHFDRFWGPGSCIDCHSFEFWDELHGVGMYASCKRSSKFCM